MLCVHLIDPLKLLGLLALRRKVCDFMIAHNSSWLTSYKLVNLLKRFKIKCFQSSFSSSKLAQRASCGRIIGLQIAAAPVAFESRLIWRTL